MCGIVGLIDYEGRFSSEAIGELTELMRDTLSHRGPDDAGLWFSADGRACLGQRRLSIIAPGPEGRQPMLNEDGNVAVTFNGEIYNFRDLRQRLEAAGHRFRSRTDTEVLCHLFEGEADEAVRGLSGMFAFGAWREHDRQLVLARDPFGKKPLYYLRHGGLLAFASELGALMLLPRDLLGGIDPSAIQEYLLLQYVHAPRSIYRHVRKLEPGTFLSVVFGPGYRVRETNVRYHSFQPREPGGRLFGQRRSQGRLVEELRHLLIDAVADRLVADVPVGAFLSGGNDSSLVLAIMARELGLRAKTYSVGFTNTPSSEHEAARQIACHLGADHHELLIEPSAVDLLPTIVDALDEPNGDSSCLPVYLLCQFARQEVTVALSGDGGDEMFGGYGRYTQTIREARHLPFRLRHWMRSRKRWKVGDAYLGDRILPMPETTLRSLTGRLEPETEELLAAMHRVANGPGPVLHRLRELDAATYLPGAVLAKVDRMSMRFGLEVRAPLLDRRIAAWAAALPADVCNDGQTTKKVLKQLALRYLPAEIVHRPKQGFGLPDQCWSQGRLLDLADSLLLEPGGQLTAHLDRDCLRRHLTAQRDPSRFHVYQIWAILVLEEWLRGAVHSSEAKLALAA